MNIRFLWIVVRFKKFCLFLFRQTEDTDLFSVTLKEMNRKSHHSFKTPLIVNYDRKAKLACWSQAEPSTLV
jgi:hypothetical protein